MEETEKLRVCKRCLLADMADEKQIVDAIRERIALMPKEDKAAEETVWERLDKCRQCDHLVSGMCGLCGCYVELRAAKRLMRCPDLPKKW